MEYLRTQISRAPDRTGRRVVKHILQAVVLVTMCLETALAQSIDVTEPAGDIRVPEGRDYATWEMANRWNMRCPDWNGMPGFPGDPVWDERFTCDIVLSESRCLTNEAFSSGTYTATSTAECGSPDPNVIMVSPGPVAGVGLSNGRLFPIDTGLYRYFTVKIRTINTADNQGSMVFFQTSGDANDPSGRTNFKTIGPGAWQVVSFDLIEDIADNSVLQWTDQEEAIGLRFDPVPNENIDFEMAWVRLTADPALSSAPDSAVDVAWTASGISGDDTFSIRAIDADGAELLLMEGIPPDRRGARADVSRLAPGTYSIEVSAGGASDQADGMVGINSAPEIHITEPDKYGDESRSYSVDQLGDSWGPMDSSDIVLDNTSQTNLENVVFNNGELEADAPDGGQSPGDPRMTFETPVGVDTDLYRMLSFEYRLEILPDQVGSVVRIFWGTSTAVDPIPDTATDDIRIRKGFNTYALGDMRKVPDREGDPGQWSGDLTVLRFDPHEVDDTREIVFRNLRLRPLDTADPVFKIQGEVNEPDPDDALVINVFADPDRNRENGNEITISENVDTGTSLAIDWDVSQVSGGEFFILAEISDGLNTVSRYSTGPVRVVNDIIFADGFESR